MWLEGRAPPKPLLLLNLTTPNPLDGLPHRNINNPDVANTFTPAWDRVCLPHERVWVENKNKSQLYNSLATINGGYSVCVLKLVCMCIYVFEEISFCCSYT